MKLMILNQTFEYPNEINSIQGCLEQVNFLLNGSEYFFSHLEIDGQDVYENHFEYIADNINSILLIEVKVNKFKELLDSSVIELGVYLTRAIPELKRLADAFYTNPSKETWLTMGQLLEGLDWILGTIEPMYSVRDNKLPYQNSLNYSVIADELRSQFDELEAALKNNDVVLIGDILKYEILERLEGLVLVVQTTIDNEVVRHDLN